MENIKDKRFTALKQMCNKIAMEQPEAIGMAFIELDCGCINVCGVSVKGDSVGTLQTIPGPFIEDDQSQPICLTCYKDKSIDIGRVINQGIMWPGDESEKPQRQLRQFIGQSVFGPDYSETPE